jgi:hypothetical protein
MAAGTHFKAATRIRRPELQDLRAGRFAAGGREDALQGQLQLALAGWRQVA